MMDKAKHTPGPWRVGSHRTVETETTPNICEVFSHVGIEEADANQRLIAAAPELLQGLEEMLALVEMSIPFDGPQQRKARAAIAKAKGGE